MDVYNQEASKSNPELSVSLLHVYHAIHSPAPIL